MHRKLVSTTALIATLAVAEAQACAFHVTGLGGFDLAYPGSLGVAMAVSDAKAEGLLTSADLPDNYAGLIFANQTMMRLGNRLRNVPDAETADFHLLLVGRRLWTEYDFETTGDGGAYEVLVHTSAPERDTPVVLTSYDVLIALEKGEISLSAAADAGVLTVLGSGGDEVLTALEFAFDA